MFLNFWKFEISYEIASNFAQMTDSVFVAEKNSVSINHQTS